MGVRLLTQDGKTAIYDSVTDTAFGPVFYGLDESEAGEDVDSEEMAEGFLRWLRQDARQYEPKTLRNLYGDFVRLLGTQGFRTLREEVPDER